MAKFIKNTELCESFFNECCLPILQQKYACLKFSAGMMTAGSQILGYDDIVSTDHGWGSCPILFLNDCDLHIRDELSDVFEKNLPPAYKGYSGTNVWITTINEIIEGYIGEMTKNDIDWLTISENRLLALTVGKLFIDMLNIQETRNRLSFYPQNVKLYLIASQWSIIGEEEAFVKRCSQVGDELGSRIVCTRIAERLKVYYIKGCYEHLLKTPTAGSFAEMIRHNVATYFKYIQSPKL